MQWAEWGELFLGAFLMFGALFVFAGFVKFINKEDKSN